MTFRKLINPRNALIVGIGLSLTACESAVITGTGSSQLGIGAAQAANLLEDGDFESGSAAWESCSTNGSSNPIPGAAAGTLAMSINDGACLYQNVEIDAGKTYQMNCTTRQDGDSWSSATFAMLDGTYTPLVSEEAQITDLTYQNQSITLTAPTHSSYAEILFFSEDSATIDNCSIQEVTVEIPAVSLSNGDFENGLTNWQQCQTGSASAESGVASLSNGSCIYQTIDVSQAVSLSPANQPLNLSLHCSGLDKIGAGYASVTIAFLDDRYEPVASEEHAIAATDTSTSVSLDAPSSTSFAEVVLFSDATTSIGNCSLSN